MQIKRLELLAPAKNMDIGIAAINCGADALYIAGPSFGARESAGNPIEDIRTLSSYAHRFGAKVYMVLNTILYDNEVGEAVRLARQAYDAGCDALIIQDPGLLKAGLPLIPIFASTQTNNRTVEQVKFIESLGFQRAILARELSLDQIRDIRSATTIELESFIHGALCVSYSGQCYLSESITGRSANRGMCAQPCRAQYDLVDSCGNIIVKNKPLLSLKDLNLSDYIKDLVLAGVTSFKIEGRLKNVSYIKNVVRHYRSIIDGILDSGTLDDRDVEYKKSSFGKLHGGFSPKPDLTFNRGYTELFIEGKRSKWQSGESAKGMGEYVGFVGKSGKDKRNLFFEYKSPIHLDNGDGLCFITPEGELVGARASTVSNGCVFTNEPVDIPTGSKVYRNYSHNFERELEQNMPKRFINVFVDFVCDKDDCHIEGICEDGTRCLVNIDGKYPFADKQDLAEESVMRQLGKATDIYSFIVKDIQAEKIPFFPASVLNGARRALAADIDRKRMECQRDNIHKTISGEIGEIKSYIGRSLDYRANVSNSLSKSFYKSLGAKNIDEAYEIAHPSPVELMRCKYCIRYELGLCLKEEGMEMYRGPLFLINKGKRYRLVFDCKNCEMVIFG